MKDRLQAALTAIDPFLQEALADLPERSALGLWACPAAVAQRCLAVGGDVQLAARVDGRTDFLALQKLGVSPETLPQSLFSLSAEPSTSEALETVAIVLPVSSRELTLGLVAAASQRVQPGGTLLMAGTKDQGMDTVAKRLREKGIEVEKRSKAHAIALRFKIPGDELKDWLDLCRQVPFQDRNGQVWHTAPGAFSHGRIDRGTQVLRDHMPQLSKQVADFGGGWGALVPALFDHGATNVTLFEASALAVDLAKQNLSDRQEDQLTVQWRDVVAEDLGGSFDHVVMNPPFHSGKMTDKNLGATFISTAHKTVKPGGTLTLVANVHLGYEHVLASVFGNCEELARVDGFKILHAYRKRR